jgi:glycosyltransferase involved in cell wall biosynthesis
MRVAVATDDLVGPAMAGSALRAWELARAVAEKGHEVVISGAPGSQPPHSEGPEIVPGTPWRWAEVVIAPPWSLPPRAFVGRHTLVADAITPLLAELDAMPTTAKVARRRRTAAARVPLVAARADAVLVGGKAHEAWWSERLADRAGVPLLTVPFGIPDRPAPSERATLDGVPDHWSVVLWWGGVWPWLDLDTLLAARARLGDTPVTVVVPVAPRPGSPGAGWTPEALDDAMRAHGLRPPQVVPLKHWIPYGDRHRILNRASVVAVLHHRLGDEAALSFRSRALDGVWTGVPLLLTEGGEVARIARQHGWGYVVPPEDAEAAAAAIERLLTEPEQARCRLQLSRARAQWTWREVVEPLLKVLPELPRVRRASLVGASARALKALGVGAERRPQP